MNNKKIMAVIGAIIVILLAVLVIYAVTSLMDEGSGPLDIGGNDAVLSSDSSSEGSSDEGSSSEDSTSGDDWGEPTVGDDDGFEGSVIPGSSSSSSGSSSESSSGSSSVPSVNISGNGNNGGSGSTGSNPGSGSSSSAPSIEDAEADGTVTYEEYIAMSGEEQQKYFESFESVEAFFAWYNDAKAKYEEENAGIEIDGSVDLGDYIGGNG